MMRQTSWYLVIKVVKEEYTQGALWHPQIIFYRNLTKILPITTFHAQTFDLVPELAALVLRVVHDGWRGWRSKAVFLDLAPVPLFPGQHALATLPLIQVVPGLGKIHVEATRVFLVRAGAQADAITCGKSKFSFSVIRSKSQSETIWKP